MVLKSWIAFMLLLVVLLLQQFALVPAAGPAEELFEFFDEFNHTCLRNCTADPEPRDCYYMMRLEWYVTMPKACYECPQNITDCYRPHCVTADGVQRAILSINRQLSGPGIHVCEGDTVRVNVRNHMEMGEAVTIHWHGIHMRDSPHMDGVSMLSQCPIPAMTSFVYSFKASPVGTHLYHSHSGMQRSDGLFGPLVVRQANDPMQSFYDFDLPEHTLLITDWLHEVTSSKFAMHHYTNGDNKSKGIIINGRGVYKGISSGNNSTATPRYTLKVQPDSRYRIRVISHAILSCPFVISITNHSLLMIASDGNPFEPRSVDSFVIFAGERYDFVLEADQPVGNYLLNVIGIADCDQRFTSARQAAIISYEGADANDLQGRDNPSYEEMAPSAGGVQLNPFNTKFNDTLVPITDLAALPSNRDTSLATVNAKFYLAFDLEIVNNTRFHYPAYYPINAIKKSDGRVYSPQMNHIASTLPSAPMLYQIADIDTSNLCNNTDFSSRFTNDFIECQHVLKVNLNDVVELIFIDKGFTFDASHPFHLHGFSFRVIGIDRVNKSVSVSEIKAMDAAGELQRNLTAPILKDSVIVPDGGYTIVRFRADNPGPWFLHCHLEFHAEMGMGVVMMVGEPASWTKHVPSNFPKCGNWPNNSTGSSSGIDEANARADRLQQQINQQYPYFVTAIAVAGAALVAMAVIGMVFLVKKLQGCRNEKAYVDAM